MRGALAYVSGMSMRKSLTYVSGWDGVLMKERMDG